MQRTVIYISDGTGITATSLGRSLLPQFALESVREMTWPFLDSDDKVRDAITRIDAIAQEDGHPPLLFSTLVDPARRRLLHQSQGCVLDLYERFNPLLQEQLQRAPCPVRGHSHGIGNSRHYNARIDALNFALASDDGISTNNYPSAEIILLGVSRSGKTPTCLYLSMQYGILAANWPLTEDDFDSGRLPTPLQPYRDKLFGLTIDPERLHQIRSERLPNSRYANRSQCQLELDAVERLYRVERIPYLNTSSMSIEEIATTVVQQVGLKRRTFG